MQTGPGAPGAPPRESLREAIGLLLAVWTALALGAAIAPATGRGPAMVASFGLATALCVLDRRAGAPGRVRSRRRAGRPRMRLARPVAGGRARDGAHRVVPALRLAGLALLGVALAPILGQIALVLGRPLGLPLPPAPLGAPSAIHVFCTLVLAPCFEEHLYRARLLPALSAGAGPAVGLLVSSIAFALPHLRPWSMLGAGLAGLLLGGWMLRTGRAADCVALHFGLNLAALAHDGAFGAASVPVAVALLSTPPVPH